MRRVIVESPFAGDIERNRRYLNACLRDCLMRGEAPFASHAIYTRDGVLRDEIAEERGLGIQAGFEWRRSAEATVVYTDLGTSLGMLAGIRHAESIGHPVEYRTLADFLEQDSGGATCSNSTPSESSSSAKPTRCV
jgi:hypothetical protein